MAFAEGVAAGDQGNGFLVVHRHAGEGLANVARCRHRVGLAVGAFGVDVDQAHLHGGERVLEVAIAAVAFIAKPGLLRPPVNVFLGFPCVGAAAAKTESLEAHRFECNVAGKHHQIGPGDLAAVFLLDRPEETARLVEIGVVGPAVERGEALLAGAGAAAAIADAVGARGVPGHADEKGTVMAEIGRPPLLRVRHQCLEVAGQRIQVEALEFGGIFERRGHRVRERGMLVQDLEVDLVRPPASVRVVTRLGVLADVAGEGAFRFC